MNKQSKKVKFLLLIFVALLGCIMTAIFCLGWSATWKILLLPSLEPVFADFRTIQGAIYSTAQGFNPQVTNPGDPWQRTMNYPLVWLDIAKIFALDVEINFLIFNLTVVLCYLAVCFRLLQKYPSYYLLATIFSIASLLAIERGNNDLIIFIILFFSASSLIYVSSILILISVTLKLYPIFAITTIFNNRKIFIAILIFIILYLATQLPDLKNITRGNSSSVHLSYGAISTVWLLQTKINALNGINAVVLSYLYVMLMMMASALLCWRRDRKVPLVSFQVNDNKRQLFLIGSSIYIGTFILSSNWDYRLIFLILCIPYLKANLTWRANYFLLICILLASNQIIWERLLGTSWGQTLGMIAKSLIFVILVSNYQNIFIFVINTLKKFHNLFVNRVSK